MLCLFLSTLFRIVDYLLFNYQPPSDKFFMTFPFCALFGGVFIFITRDFFIKKNDYVLINEEDISFHSRSANRTISWKTVTSIELDDYNKKIKINTEGGKFFEFSLRGYKMDFATFASSLEALAARCHYNFKVSQ